MHKELVKLANHLDSINHRDLADRLDSIILKEAASWKWGSDPVEEVQKALNKKFTAGLVEDGKWGDKSKKAWKKHMSGKDTPDTPEEALDMVTTGQIVNLDRRRMETGSEESGGQAASPGESHPDSKPEVDFDSRDIRSDVEMAEKGEVLAGGRGVLVRSGPDTYHRENTQRNRIFKELTVLLTNAIPRPRKAKALWEEALNYTSIMLWEKPYSQLTEGSDEKGYVETSLDGKFTTLMMKNPVTIKSGPFKGKTPYARLARILGDDYSKKSQLAGINKTMIEETKDRYNIADEDWAELSHRERREYAKSYADVKSGKTPDVQWDNVPENEIRFVKKKPPESGAIARESDALDSEASTQEELINKRAEDLSSLFSLQDIPSVRR